MIFHKKLIPACVLGIACAVSLTAQQNGARYRYDNFDTNAGVRLTVVAPKPEVVPVKTPADSPLKKQLVTSARGKSGKDKSGKFVTPTIYVAPAVSATANSLGGYTTGNANVDRFIMESGARHGVDTRLLYAIMHQESSFKPRALSNKGAAGLMQLMPGTAARFGVRDRYDPQQSIDGGTKYMRWLLNYFGGREDLALAGYNAGEGAVIKYGRQIPPYRETREYVRRIMGRYNLIRDPQTVRRAPVATPVQIAKAEIAKPIPLPVYEQSIFAVRLPDGKLRLMTQ